MVKGPEISEEVRRKHANPQHRMVLVDREAMTVDGVLNVESFDDEEIILETNAGVLSVRGHDLHIKQLNLEDGNLEIDGLVESVDYSEDDRKRGRGFLARLLR
ncbi:MAG: sporulation protein YabP [Firmicutes bacterium]|jgi:sporulation protein YabP|nr:sporulation protein YabP [Bacillota bacterium]